MFRSNVTLGKALVLSNVAILAITVFMACYEMAQAGTYKSVPVILLGMVALLAGFGWWLGARLGGSANAAPVPTSGQVVARRATATQTRYSGVLQTTYMLQILPPSGGEAQWIPVDQQTFERFPPQTTYSAR